MISRPTIYNLKPLHLKLLVREIELSEHVETAPRLR